MGLRIMTQQKAEEGPTPLGQPRTSTYLLWHTSTHWDTYTLAYSWHTHRHTFTYWHTYTLAYTLAYIYTLAYTLAHIHIGIHIHIIQG